MHQSAIAGELDSISYLSATSNHLAMQVKTRYIKIVVQASERRTML